MEDKGRLIADGGQAAFILGYRSGAGF